MYQLACRLETIRGVPNEERTWEPIQAPWAVAEAKPRPTVGGKDFCRPSSLTISTPTVVQTQLKYRTHDLTFSDHIGFVNSAQDRRVSLKACAAWTACP